MVDGIYINISVSVPRSLSLGFNLIIINMLLKTSQNKLASLKSEIESNQGNAKGEFVSTVLALRRMPNVGKSMQAVLFCNVEKQLEVLANSRNLLRFQHHTNLEECKAFMTFYTVDMSRDFLNSILSLQQISRSPSAHCTSTLVLQ